MYRNRFITGILVLIVVSGCEPIEESESSSNQSGSSYIVIDNSGANPLVDMEVVELSIPDNWIPDEKINITETIANTGETLLEDVEIGVYISANSLVTTMDDQLANRKIHELKASTQSTASHFVGLPQNYRTGLYYIGLIADYNNETHEDDEDNNTLQKTIEVTYYPCTDDIYEQNDDYQSAYAISENFDYAGVTCSINADFYKVEVPQDREILTVTMIYSESIGDLDMSLLNDMGQWIEGSREANGQESIEYDVSRWGGTYYVKIYQI